jgi:methylated-DNA-[protein]-cysteine S-methyltransferase
MQTRRTVTDSPLGELTLAAHGDAMTGVYFRHHKLAAQLGEGVTAYEVGQAAGRNPLSIVVPCQRVVGKNGAITGYAGGMKRKRFLLDLEAPIPAVAGRLF